MSARVLVIATALLSSLSYAENTCSWQLSIQWEAESTISGPSDWPPLILNDVVYTIHTGVGVTAVDRSTGTLIWQIADESVVGGPSYSRGKLLVPRTDSLVAVGLQDGVQALVFSGILGIPCQFGAPVVTDRKIVFGTSNGYVYALSSGALELVWMADLGMDESILAPASIWDGKIVVGSLKGVVWVISATGEIISSFTTPGVSAGEGIHTQILVDNDMAYYAVSSAAVDFVALDLVRMRQKWAVSLADEYYAYSSPTIDYNGLIFTTTFDGAVFGVNSADGKVKFRHDSTQTLKIRGPLYRTSEDLLVFATTTGTLMGYDIAKRKRAFSLRFGGEVKSNPAVFGNDIFLPTAGVLYEARATCIGRWQR